MTPNSGHPKLQVLVNKIVVEENISSAYSTVHSASPSDGLRSPGLFAPSTLTPRTSVLLCRPWSLASPPTPLPSPPLLRKAAQGSAAPSGSRTHPLSSQGPLLLLKRGYRNKDLWSLSNNGSPLLLFSKVEKNKINFKKKTAPLSSIFLLNWSA